MRLYTHSLHRFALAPTVGPAQLVALSRGLSGLFWGLPLTLLLLFGAVQVEPLHRIPLSPHLAGALVVATGMVHLARCRDLTDRWNGLCRQGLWIGFLLFYFAPFVHWWLRLPAARILQANMAALLATTIWLLVTVNRLAGEVGRVIGHEELHREARWTAWSVVVMMMIPMGTTLAVGLYGAARFHSNLLFELGMARRGLPVWIYLLFLVPFALTMSSAWKAKELCLGALRAGGRRPEP